MRAMVLESVQSPLVLRDVPVPTLKKHELLIRVHVCGVCRTDLHIMEGDLPSPKLPLILGHQVVGTVEEVGAHVLDWKRGDRVGVPWFGGSCRTCAFCLSHRENLCDHGMFTGYLRDGGYADFCTVEADNAIKLSSVHEDVIAAPLLCAGVIGYRAFCKVKEAQQIGFYGFGSSAHILLQVANALGKEIFVFTKKESEASKNLAKTLGAAWVGDAGSKPPCDLDAALLFAPVGEHYPMALSCIKKGGTVVSVGIHMSDIPSFPYRLLWGERTMTSVANLTRDDGKTFMELVDKMPLKLSVRTFSLTQANEALLCIKQGNLVGSLVLTLS